MKAKGKIDVTEEIEYHIVSQEPVVGWVHTHGMAKFGKPELEIRDVPLFLSKGALSVLCEVCDYILNTGNNVRLGQTMEVERNMIFQFVKSTPIEGAEDHFRDERWQLVDIPMRGMCTDPNCPDKH